MQTMEEHEPRLSVPNPEYEKAVAAHLSELVRKGDMQTYFSEFWRSGREEGQRDLLEHLAIKALRSNMPMTEVSDLFEMPEEEVQWLHIVYVK